MGDPLSVAASITGLLTLAAQLYTTLDTFVSSVKDAPSLSRTILAEMRSFHNSLYGLQELLNHPKFHCSTRGCLVSADYVVVSFTDAVLLFSELDAILTPLTAYAPGSGFAAKAQWLRKKPRLNELVGRLQWQKLTLVLQLNILKCASDVDAEHNLQVLSTMIGERLARDQDMARRLAQVEDQLLLRSVRDDATIHSGISNDSDNRTITATRPNLSTIAGGAANANGSTSGDLLLREFETHLNTSWVYRRNAQRDETMSFHSSVLRPSAWSMLSDLSMTNISVIAVMALPVQLQELSNGHCYTRIFEDGILDPQPSVPLMNSSWFGPFDGPSDIEQLAQTLFDPQFTSDVPLDGEGSAKDLSKGGGPSSPDGFQDETILSALLGPRGTDITSTQINAIACAEEFYPKSLLPVTTDPTIRQVFPKYLPWVDSDEAECLCKACGEEIVACEAFDLAGDRWHIKCFRCKSCENLLDYVAGILEVLGDGSLLCHICTESCGLRHLLLCHEALKTQHKGNRARRNAICGTNMCKNCWRGIEFETLLTRNEMYCDTCFAPGAANTKSKT